MNNYYSSIFLSLLDEAFLQDWNLTDQTSVESIINITAGKILITLRAHLVASQPL